MPLYVAEYATQASVVVHAASPEHVVAMLEACKLDAPKRLHLVPEGVFMAELYAEDEDSEVESYRQRDEIPNPANHSQGGYAFEPLDPLTDWLDIMHEASKAEDAKEAAGTAPTEEPPPPAPPTEDELPPASGTSGTAPYPRGWSPEDEGHG